eukprot:scaffold2909_cov78-Cylindrotheca_fusiformis.AAC.10
MGEGTKGVGGHVLTGRHKSRNSRAKLDEHLFSLSSSAMTQRTKFVRKGGARKTQMPCFIPRHILPLPVLPTTLEAVQEENQNDAGSGSANLLDGSLFEIMRDPQLEGNWLRLIFLNELKSRRQGIWSKGERMASILTIRRCTSCATTSRTIEWENAQPTGGRYEFDSRCTLSRSPCNNISS